MKYLLETNIQSVALRITSSSGIHLRNFQSQQSGKMIDLKLPLELETLIKGATI